MNGSLGYVVHSVYITFGLFKIYYRINFLDNMDTIIPVIGKRDELIWKKPTALLFLVINALNLNLE